MNKARGWHRRSSARALVLISTIAIYALLWSNNAALAQDKNWAAALAPPANGGTYGPVEALAIQIPQDVPFDALLRLGLEVDAIDVTPLLAFENQVFTFNPPQALFAGSHEVRLVDNQPDGNIVERGSWTIEIAGGGNQVAAAPGDAASTGADKGQLSLAAQNSLELSQRLADSGLEGTPDRFVVSGSGYGNGSYDRGPWSFTGNANYLGQSIQARAPSENNVDLGEYNFTGRFNGEDLFGQVALGHQDLGANNFIMSGFNRRGLSASVGSADQAYSLTGFGFRPEAVTGADEFTGLNDGNNRLTGFMATAQPIPGLGQDFTVRGLYYSGEGSDVGTGGGGDATANQGKGWGLVADSYWFDRSVQVKGQFTQTDFEYGGVVLGDNSETSDAWSALLAYTPVQGEEVGGAFMNLTVGTQYERVGTFFNSLANPSLATDRDSALVYSDLSWGEFSANAQGLHQTNNVDDVTGVPTDRLLSFQFSGNYYPTIDPPAAGEIDWLGQPFVNFNLGITDNSRKKTPDGYAGNGTDNQNRSVTLGVGSNFTQWGWQLSETFTRFEDDTDNASDTDNYLTDFSSNWMVNDSLSLDGGLQWGLFKDRDASTKKHTVNLNLGLQAELIPETLNAKLNYNLNLLTGSGDTPDNRIANGEVEWTLLAPEPNNIGVALAFQGLLEKNNGNADDSLNGSSWQIFSVLRFTAPLAN